MELKRYLLPVRLHNMWDDFLQADTQASRTPRLRAETEEETSMM